MKTIFVSSSFKDMQAERDAIQRITLPAVKEKARAHGDNISFCDLRWGINTAELDEKESNSKVLDVCLDEIDRSDTPMVVILGDRYGWDPDDIYIEAAADKKRIDKNWLKNEMSVDKLKISVTSLEIAYGALLNEDKLKNTLFYFRNLSDNAPEYCKNEGENKEEHTKKLEALKARIIERVGKDRVHTYNVDYVDGRFIGVDEFAYDLAEEIKKALEEEWKELEGLTPFQREIRLHRKFALDKSAAFSSREGVIRSIRKRLDDGGESVLCLKASSGSGKSMLMSRLFCTLEAEGENCLLLFCGLTSESNDAMDILRKTVYYLEEVLCLPHVSESAVTGGEGASAVGRDGKAISEKDALRDRLEELCIKCDDEGKGVYVLIDAVDQLADDQNREELAFLPRRACKSVKFIISCLPGLDTLSYPVEGIRAMDDGDKLLVVNKILESHGKSLEQAVIDKMLAHEDSGNPMFLSLLVQRLIMMDARDFDVINKNEGSMAAITERQLYIINNCPGTLEEMSYALLLEAGDRINSGLTMRAAELLAVSRHGLRAEDLEELIGEDWLRIDFSHFINYMSESFIRRDDGRYDFSHKCFRDGFLMLCKDRVAVHREILEHLKRLPVDDDVMAQEITYHTIMADDKAFFAQYVALCHEKEELRVFAQKDAFSYSMSDGGEWIIELLKTAKADSRLARFIYLGFVDGTPVERLIEKKILGAVLEYIDRNDNDFICSVKSNACNQYAFVCSQIGGKENDTLAIEYYDRSLRLAEESAEKLPDVDFREFIALRYTNLAYTLRTIGGLGNYDRALKCLNRAVELRKQVYDGDRSAENALKLASSYDELGRLLTGYYNEDDLLEQAEHHLEMALELKKYASGKLDCDGRLIGSYSNLANLYLKKKKDTILNKEYTLRAIEYYYKAFELAERCFSRTRKAAYLSKMMTFAYHLGNIYVSQIWGYCNPAEAKRWYMRAVETFGRIDEHEKTDAMLEVYAHAKAGVGITISVAKLKEHYPLAKSCFEEAETVLVKFAEDYGTSNTKLSLINFYQNYAYFCAVSGLKADVDLGFELCDKAIRLADEIKNSGGISFNYPDYCMAIYGRLVELNLKRGRIFKAIACFFKAIRCGWGELSIKADRDEVKKTSK